MIVSHSRIECFENCPHKYDLKYNKKLKTIPDDKPDNALYLGTALHTGIEKDVYAALHSYYNSYSIITNEHINEAMKLEYLIPLAKKMLPKGEYEVKIEDDDFIGYIDLLAPARTEQKLNGEHQIIPNLYDLYDFKYSNNVNKYKDSPQLHLYKFFFEKNNPGKKIRNMYFFFVPKVRIKQKNNESLHRFRQRILKELSGEEPKTVQIEYDPNKVIKFLLATKKVLEATEYPKNNGWLCSYCEYKKFCQKGVNYMILPSTERRQIGQTIRRKLWIYGPAFSGKTTFLDKAPNPLNLNTDGNINFVTMPYVSIKDEVTVKGRMTERKFAWEVFKDTIAELEKKQNDFKTIIVDLVEDTREMCRLYKYDELGVQHESDSGFGKGWDIIKTEYLSTMRRFFNLDYENLVIVSHEDVSKDITKKNGQNITRISPNIQDAIANKLAGMVDIVARVVVEDDDSRTLNFKQSEVIFGGGRLTGIRQTTIPLDWDALMEVYDEANEATSDINSAEKKSSRKPSRKAKEEEKPEDLPWEEEKPEEVEAVTPQAEEVPEEPVKEPVEEEQPKKRIRKRRE